MINDFLTTTATNNTFNIETSRIRTLIPVQLREDASGLIEFLEEYYRLSNTTGNPSNLLSGLTKEHDIDSVTEEMFSGLQNLIAKNIPNSRVFDRRTLYKRIIDYYSLRGSEASITTFFKIFFNELSTVYYPKNDLLKPSDGKFNSERRYYNGWYSARKLLKPSYDYPPHWTASDITPIPVDSNGYITDPTQIAVNWNISDFNAGYYSDRNGFISESAKKLQDGHYWQDYSYEITNDINLNDWHDEYLRLVHPAGMKLFNRINHTGYSLNSWTRPMVYDKNDITDLISPWRIPPPLPGDHSPVYQPGDIDNRKVPFELRSYDDTMYPLTNTNKYQQIATDLSINIISTINLYSNNNLYYMNQLNLNTTDYLKYLKFSDSSMQLGYAAESFPYAGDISYNLDSGLLNNNQFPPTAVGTYISLNVKIATQLNSGNTTITVASAFISSNLLVGMSVSNSDGIATDTIITGISENVITLSPAVTGTIPANSIIKFHSIPQI
jgi:hypothetical protein